MIYTDTTLQQKNTGLDASGILFPLHCNIQK